MAKVLTKSRATVWSPEMMQKALVQTVLLYGSDSWEVRGSMLTVIESFHHWAAIRVSGKTAWSAGDGGWEWTPVEESLEVTGLWPIKEYIKRR